MAELTTLGPREAVDLLQTYTGIDLARLMQFSERSGLTATGLLQQAFAAIGGANQAVRNRYGGLSYITTSLDVKYRQGDARSKTPKRVDGANGDAVRSTKTGHMLPLSDYEDVLQWTDLWARDANQSDVDNDLSLISERWINRVEDDFWTRALTNTENAIGGGFDVGWAIGSGTSVNYIPTPYGGTTFTSSHTHYLYKDGTSSANVLTLIENMVKEVRHHGITGRLQMFVSESDIDTYAGMAKFVALQPAGFTIVPGNGAASVQIAQGENSGLPGELFGYVNTSRGVVELYYYSRLATGYVFLTKSYGDNNPNNGIALRVHPDVPFGLIPDPVFKNSVNPKMQQIDLNATYGFGVNKRLNGVAGYFASGASAYVNPSFS